MATYNPPNTGAGTGIGGEPGSTTYGREDSGRVTGPTSTSVGEAENKAAGVTGAIGTRLERAGDYLEEKGKAAFVSDRLHTAGRYLQENDVRSITKAVDSAICAHPYRSMLVGLGMGWVIGKFFSR